MLVTYCDVCGGVIYEGDVTLTFKETQCTIINPTCCDEICMYNITKKYPFLENYQYISTKIKKTDNNYYSNLCKFMLCDIYYTKIITYDCNFDNVKILQYIHNILKKTNKTDWEKKFITNCLRYNLLKIEKII